MKTILRTENLYRQFANGVVALRDVSIDIAQSEFVAIVGRSGSGKSTLMNILGGLDMPSGGRVLLGGEELDYSDRRRMIEHRRKTIGFVFQQFNLLASLTALENVAYPLLFNYAPPEEREERATRLLSLVGLEGRAGHLPHQLSGGEQQRVAIARALVNNPEIILADEPTGNLDSKTSSEIYQLMRNINEREGITFLIVTHERELASYCDRIIQMRDGMVVN